MPNAAPQVAHALGAANAGAFDVGAACTGFLAALALAQRGRSRPVRRAVRARDRRRASCRGSSTPTIARTAAAVRRRRRRGGRLRATPRDARRPVRARRATAPRPAMIRRRPRASGVFEMDGHETFRNAVARLSTGTDAAASRGRGSASTTSTCSSTTRPTRASCVRRRAAGAAARRASSTASPSSATRAPRACPLALSLARDGRAPAARDARPAGRRRRRAHVGRRVDALGGRVSVGTRPRERGAAPAASVGTVAGRAPRQGCALVTGASRGIGAAIALALAADGWPVGVNFRSDELGARETLARDRGSRRPRAGRSGPTSPTRPRSMPPSRRSRGAWAGARARQQRRRARRRPRALAQRRALGLGDRHQPDRGLPAHPARAARR